MRLAASTLLGALAVVPFIVMETINNRVNEFPTALFLFMWLLFSICIFAGIGVWKGFRRRGSESGATVSLVLSAVVLVAVGIVLTSLMSDQMPCFLGVPNCD